MTFITADHTGDGLLSGFGSVCLGTDWTDMDSELPRLRQLIEERRPSLLLIDSYRVTEGYFRELRPLVPLAYMDDLNQARWDTDCLINYNIIASVFDYSAYDAGETRLLLGPEYAPLRDEFQHLPPPFVRDGAAEVLVSAGGADPEGITEKLIRETCPRHPALRFHFIVGALNPRLKEIQALAGERVVLHIRENRMAELMRSCDIAVSAAGTTLYELCACGVPTIVYSMADNQVLPAEEFARRGIMLSAGDCREDAGFTDRVDSQLRALTAETELRRELSRRMRDLVDGNGAARIARALKRVSSIP